MNIIIDNKVSNQKLHNLQQKIQVLNEAENQVAEDRNDKNEFFVTKPKTMNDYFLVEDAIQDLVLQKGEVSKKDELMDDLNSLFDNNDENDSIMDSQRNCPNREEDIDQF